VPGVADFEEGQGSSMLKTIAGLLPLAVGLAAVGIAIWWLISNNLALGTWALGGFIVAHGLLHVLFVTPAPARKPGAAEWPFDLSRPWLVMRFGLPAGGVRMVGLALIAVVVAGFVLAGLSTVGVLVPAAWWRPLIVVSAAASGATLIIFFSLQLVLGRLIDAILLWIAILAVWAPSVSS
jgi:hypothetical protein